MRKLFLIASFLGLCFFAQSQTWSKRIGTIYEEGDAFQQSDWAYAIEKSLTGSYTVFKGRDSLAIWGLHAYSLDFQGNIIANSFFSRTDTTYVDGLTHSIAKVEDDYWHVGTIILQFGTPATTAIHLNGFNLNGDTIAEHWIQVDTLGKAAYHLTFSSDNHFMICGNADGGGHGDMFLKKVSYEGEEIWHQQYNHSGTSRDYASCVLETSDGGFLLGGLTDAPSFWDMPNSWIVKTDAEGNMEWDLEIGDISYSDGHVYINALDDGTYVAGGRKGLLLDDQDDTLGKLKLIKFSEEGIILWEKVYGSLNKNIGIQKVIQNSDGDIVAAGVYKDEFNDNEGVILKTNIEGDSIWMRTFRHSYDETANNQVRDIIQDDQGYYVGCGMVQTSIFSDDPEKGQDAWVFRLDPFGCLVPGCELVDVQNLENKDKVWFTFGPNPAQDFLNIYFAELLSNEQNLQLSVYNSQGQLMQERVNVSSGTTFIHPVYALASGLYVLELSSEKGVLQRETFVKE